MPKSAYDDYIAALFRVIFYIGSQALLAKYLGVSPVVINHWLNRNKHIPYHYALAMEKLTNGYVKAYELSPNYARIIERMKTVKPCARFLAKNSKKLVQKEKQNGFTAPAGALASRAPPDPVVLSLALIYSLSSATKLLHSAEFIAQIIVKTANQ